MIFNRRRLLNSMIIPVPVAVAFARFSLSLCLALTNDFRFQSTVYCLLTLLVRVASSLNENRLTQCDGSARIQSSVGQRQLRRRRRRSVRRDVDVAIDSSGYFYSYQRNKQEEHRMFAQGIFHLD